MKIGCYHLISEFMEKQNIDSSLKPFLTKIEKHLGEDLSLTSPSEVKRGDILPVIFIKSGGVEEKFKRIYQQFPPPYLLLASCLYNSLPAALEIKSYLQKRGERVEILHGSEERIAQRLKSIKKIMETKKACRQYRIGVLGKPSDWLISSGADYNAIKKRLGMRVYDIPIEEMVRHIDGAKGQDIQVNIGSVEGFDTDVFNKSLQIYQGLKNLMAEYKFNAITVRCFELIDFYKNTGCLALSLLNREGLFSGCEGDVPSLVSMIILSLLTDEPVFLANPVCIDDQKKEIIFAHCTIPLNMCESFEFKNHFESGVGTAVRGKVKKGSVTIFKLDGNAEKYFLSEGEIVSNLESSKMCRTQLKIALKIPVIDFLENSIANHHLICKGWHGVLLEQFFSYL